MTSALLCVYYVDRFSDTILTKLVSVLWLIMTKKQLNDKIISHYLNIHYP